MIEMLNQLVMVGRIANKPELRKTETGKNVTTITLAVPRNYKNEEGVYDTDFIDTTLWNSVAENTVEYCKVGDMVGVKGHIQTRNVEDKEGNKIKKVEVVAEKVTFLAQSKDNPKKDLERGE